MPEGTRTNKRANHNAMERKRRDHIKDSFDGLRKRVDITNEKASRSSILQKAKDRITDLEAKIRQQEEDEEKLIWANEDIRRKLASLGDVEFVDRTKAEEVKVLVPTSPLKKYTKRSSPLSRSPVPVKVKKAELKGPKAVGTVAAGGRKSTAPLEADGNIPRTKSEEEEGDEEEEDEDQEESDFDNE